MEGREQRRNSGRGQKDAKERRVKSIAESIKEFVGEVESETVYINKADFHKVLCNAFEGIVPHPRTTKNYKSAVEDKLGKKIVLTKKSLRKGTFI
jgi:hypothetical protein